jgi:Protein of unknown function (DUF1045)
MGIPEPTPRYAIYFVPGHDTELYRFGASVLGYDCYTGYDMAWIDGADSPSWTEFVREPRIYGFHATLKAPFYLANGWTETGLKDAVREFAANHAAVTAGKLVVRELGTFVALVPDTRKPHVDRLAQACVQELDSFRAPMREPERGRRLAAGLTAGQIENLERWGYPYVAEDFRFHMTLTGSLAPPKRDQTLRFLRDRFERVRGANPVTIDQIVVARQADPIAPFRLIQVATLGRSAHRPFAYTF